MTILVPNNGEGDFLKAGLNHTAMSDVIMKLYSSNTTPAETDTAASFTETTFTGYSASGALTGSSWTITEGAPSNGTYAQQTFTSSAGSQSVSVYGYFMVRNTGGRIAWAERFSDGPYVIVNNGDQIKVTPVITFD